jgi:2-polyprenyl-3-methyl-5-hydroxy-6-metoxy-1,4-benzoquinol methylase
MNAVEQIVREPAVEFIPVPCSLCRVDDAVTLGFRDRLARCRPPGKCRYRIVRCRRCGLIYVNPQPRIRLSDAAGLYSEDYYRSHPGFAINSEAISQRYHDAELSHIERFIAVGSLLELGCAQGFFLERAALRGWKVQGIDVSNDAIAEGRRRFHLPLIAGTLEENILADESFDVIYSHHMLEHAPDPCFTLTQATRRLKPGGLLVVGVPNEGSLSAHVGHLRAKLLGEEWTSYLCPPLHLVGFTRNSLANVLRHAGLTVEQSWVSGAGSGRYPPHRELKPFFRMEPFAAKKLIMRVGQWLGQGEWLVAYARKP